MLFYQMQIILVWITKSYKYVNNMEKIMKYFDEKFKEKYLKEVLWVLVNELFSWKHYKEEKYI